MLSPTVITWIVIVFVFGLGGWRIYKDCKKMEKENKKKTKIIHYNHNGRYACNEAIGTTKEKLTEDWKKVTCKNCPKAKFYY